MSPVLRSGFTVPSRVVLSRSGLAALVILSISAVWVKWSSPTLSRRPTQMSVDAQPASVGRPATDVKTLSCTPLSDLPGKSITTALVTFPPNAFTARHRHPGSVTAYVLKGVLRSQLEGSGSSTYSAGQTWFEPAGTIHLFAENASATEPAELLAFFVTDQNCGPLTIFE